MGRRRKNYDHLSYAEIAEMEMGAKATEHGEEQRKEAEKKSRKEEITCANLRRLLKKNEYRCMLSGVTLDPKEASLDHSIPLSKGGEHVMTNIKIVHEVINRMKGTLSEAEFIGWCRKVAQWNS